ncbi:uncharacterized protein F4822DRAFT_431198 [Hypoxylon trugodes]|uniref:uncharacterized protein n=1 Tax=Hypoxylon trugodes TaxID=326681 RepID=UPI0021920DAF|nr:uncharacterized protein F4822DRAFT_431198 [Hypoxylon trugodes]KAI1386327.1 hypothetical protein F4822DRAFT_431198 [Hypoxylon trugodes]
MDTRFTNLPPCEASIEQLFKDLPDPESEDNNDKPWRQYSKYKNALSKFLKTEMTSRREHIDECILFRAVAYHMLSNWAPKIRPPRYQFIETMANFFLDLPLIGDQDSAKLRYFRYCKWIFQGRKDSYNHRHQATAAGGEHNGPTQRRRDFSHLTKSLTVPSHCNYCQKPEVKFTCSGCARKNSGSLTIATGYCGKDCQTLDWNNHKGICFDRKRLGRAVNLTRKLMGVVEYRLSNLTLEGTFEIDGILCLTEESRAQRALRGDCFLKEINSKNYLENVDVGHIQQAVEDQYFTDIPLVLSSSSQIYTWLYSGLCHRIEEFLVYVKNANRPIVRFTVDDGIKSNMLQPHRVLRVTMKSGEQFAVDLACGRFGWEEYVTLWDHYMKERIFRVIRSDDLGEFALKYNMKIPPYYPVTAKAKVHLQWLDEIVEYATKLLEQQGLSIHFGYHFVGMADHHAYTAIEAAIIEKVLSFDTEKIVGPNSLSGCQYRMYLNNHAEEWVEWNWTDKLYLEMVWLQGVAMGIFENDHDFCKEFWVVHISAMGLGFKEKPPSAQEVLYGATVFSTFPDQDAEGYTAAMQIASDVQN